MDKKVIVDNKLRERAIVASVNMDVQGRTKGKWDFISKAVCRELGLQELPKGALKNQAASYLVCIISTILFIVLLLLLILM
jgi:hypothetical protein